MSTNKALDELILIAKKASQTGWGPYPGNIPFYCIVKKPRHSLSIDDKPLSHHWHIDDAMYLGTFQPKNLIPLLERLKELEAKEV